MTVAVPWLTGRAVDALQPVAAGQPEIQRDLTASPPNLVDADARLLSLLDALRGRAEARSARGGLRDRGNHLWMRVARDQRTPRAHVVHVAVAVHVKEPGTLAPLHEDGVAADRAHGANRGVHTARQKLECPAVQLLGASGRALARAQECSASQRL